MGIFNENGYFGKEQLVASWAIHISHFTNLTQHFLVTFSPVFLNQDTRYETGGINGA